MQAVFPFKKTLALSAVFLLLSLSYATVLAGDKTTNPTVEVLVELSGFPDKRIDSVRLTAEQADHLDDIFKDLHEKQDSMMTNNEASLLFHNTIIELGRLKLLGSLTPEEFEKTLQKISSQGDGIQSDMNPNVFCYVSGETSRTSTINLLTVIAGGYGIVQLFFLSWLLDKFPAVWENIKANHPNLYKFIQNIVLLPFVIVLLNIPISLVSIVFFGYSVIYLKEKGGIEYYPARGWVNTRGMYGYRQWNGTFFGGIHAFGLSDTTMYQGISGFKGLTIYEENTTKIFGIARKVDLFYHYESPQE